MRQDGLKIEARAGMQYLDSGQHKLRLAHGGSSWRLFRGASILGTLEVGTKETATVIAGVTYIKGILDGAEIFEKDKVNLIDRVLGVDYALPIRQAIGIV